MIYLDYAATTPLAPTIAELIDRTLRSSYGNASSIHGIGRQAKTVLEESRERLAGILQVKSDEVYFTSGGTESDNAAVIGTALALRRQGKTHVIISVIEHHAVLHAASHLESLGFSVTRIPVDGDGRIDPDSVRDAILPTTGLVSIMHANNETGTIQPIREIADVVHGAGALVHTDAVQSFGKIPTAVPALGVDLLSISAHKIYGPKGIGALVMRKGIANEPLLHGGGQESGRRPGTENVAFACALAHAAGEMEQMRDHETVRLQGMRKRLLERLRSAFEGIIVNGHATEVLPTIVNISFDSAVHHLDGEALIMNLDLEGIAVTSGSACTSGSLIPSHVLLAMGRDAETARATVRFSLGRMTTEDEVLQAVNVLERVVKRMNAV